MPTITISDETIQALDRALVALTESMAETRYETRKAQDHWADVVLPHDVREAFARQAEHHRREYRRDERARRELSRLQSEADSGGPA